MPLSIIEGDIARIDTDAVVNAANEGLRPGGGVCGAIFAGAGFSQMQRACDAIGHCPTGSAVVTPGFGLPARLVVHAVGPVWRGGGFGEEVLLRSAYRSALSAARDAGARSVAFPLISAGIYGYPQHEALRVAESEIRAFLDAQGADELDVRLVIRDRTPFARMLAGFDDVAACVEDALASPASGLAFPTSVGMEGASRPFADAAPDGDAFADAPVGADALEEADADLPPFEAGDVFGAPAPRTSFRATPMAPAAQAARPLAPQAQASPAPGAASEADADLAARLGRLDASFAQTVLALIDARGLTDVQVYKRANLSRQVFSKLRRDDGYRPTKQTAVALACALELDLPQTRDLLARAGFALGHASAFDIIVEYFIERGRHDVVELNEMLFAFDQPLLGSV